MIVGEIFHTELNANVLTGQQMPDQPKHQKGGDGFKQIFDEACEKIRKEIKDGKRI